MGDDRAIKDQYVTVSSPYASTCSSPSPAPFYRVSLTINVTIPSHHKDLPNQALSDPIKSLKSPHNMFLLRTVRQQPRFVAAATSTRVPAATISRRFASGDYGSGEHNDLKRSKSDHEHPGPPPPSTGDKGSSKGASQQKSNDSGSSQTTSNGAKPKILSASPPKEGEEPPEVAKHNEEIRKRADKPNEGASNADAEKDKVSKSFWKGA